MVSKMEEDRVEENINELQQKLVPTKNIIDIFNRLGEEFKQESGAMALSKDLVYLESLIIKDDKKISEEEKIQIEKYLNSIREKMSELENILTKIKEYFDKMNATVSKGKNQLLKNRMIELEQIIHRTNSNTMIVSHMTKNLNLIIENMRQCLGCLRKESNNDTNLAFGDYNKFFIINQGEKEKGSISDEIVFFVPTKTQNGQQEMSFVLDRAYGVKSPDILISNILSVIKKYQSLKKEFSEAKISILITNEAMFSVGISAEVLMQHLKKSVNDLSNIKMVEDLIVDIPQSVFSDNYIEFGKSNGSRQSGERASSGLIIK